MGPDSVFTHKILGLTDKIVINPDSTIFYRIHENQISQRIENQPDELLKNISRGKIDVFVTFILYVTKSSKKIRVCNLLRL